MSSGPRHLREASTRRHSGLPPPSEIVSAATASGALGRTLTQGKLHGDPPGEQRAWGRELTAQAGSPGAAPGLQNERRVLAAFTGGGPLPVTQPGPSSVPLHLPAGAWPPRLQGSALRRN